jgi:predicted CoA-binding protein
MSKTVIMGATPNNTRYAYAAAERLHRKNIPFIPLGIKKGEVFGEKILDLRAKPIIKDVHTVTMYIGPQNQAEWEQYIIELRPNRVIFNPGTENPEFMEKLRENNIAYEAACTLVMLSTGTY